MEDTQETAAPVAPFTARKLIETVRAIALELPRRTYQKPHGATVCRYAPDERNPDGCLFGAAMRRLGLESQKDWDAVNGKRPHLILQPLGVTFTPGERAWCVSCQAEQDRGATWADAVEMADAGNRFELGY